ncbi:MAG: WecB/TagA/CpsF family glycosyltransferase [Clostridia bacterium]|nr:WecB/TagA/CpsF family glycosyltransferase [Clostridia bacterium]MBR6523302.1 WecB/TagA/CpsF family glycosyltransferase [Clostridia bacterium]
MRNTVEILGVNVDKLTFKEALEVAWGLLKSDGVSAIFTPNPEIIMCAKEDLQLREILNNADLCTADGIGVVYGSKILKDPVPERVAGFDLTCALLERVSKTDDGVFLFGAKPGVAEIAKANLEEKYPGIKIAGTRDGYFKPEEEEEIVNQINQSKAKLLLVCLGAPKQEKWIAAHKKDLKVNLCMGVGGTLDVLAGTAKRAPKIFIKLNLEWVYRLLKNPSRIGRFAALPKFVIEVFKAK